MISETDLSEHICRRYIELPARSRRLAESRENTGTCFAINRLALVVWNPGNLFNCDNARAKLPSSNTVISGTENTARTSTPKFSGFL